MNSCLSLQNFDVYHPKCALQDLTTWWTAQCGFKNLRLKTENYFLKKWAPSVLPPMGSKPIAATLARSSSGWSPGNGPQQAMSEQLCNGYDNDKQTLSLSCFIMIYYGIAFSFNFMGAFGGTSLTSERCTCAKDTRLQVIIFNADVFLAQGSTEYTQSVMDLSWKLKPNWLRFA